MVNNLINDISLVTVTFNSEKVIEKFSSTAKLFKHVVIVDNNSEDSTEKLCGLYIPHAIFIKNKVNLGFSAANNIGLKESLKKSINYCIFVNPDCSIEFDSLNRLRSVFDTDENIVLANPKMLENGSASNNVLVWDYREPYENISPKKVNLENLDLGESGFAEGVCINGACFMVNSRKFEKIGAFSDEIFLYMEEDDIGLRISRSDYKSVYVPDALAVHVGGGSTPKSTRIDLRKSYHYKWSKMYLNNIYVGKSNRFFEALKISLIAPLALLFAIIFMRGKLAKRWFSWWFAGLDGLFMTKFFRRFF